MPTLRILLAITTGTIFQYATAAEPLRLICTYSSTVDQTGRSSPTTGQDLFTVSETAPGQVAIKKQDQGAHFLGSMSSEKIRGIAEYELQGIAFKQELLINRITGAMSLTFGRRDGEWLIHYGECRAASKMKF